MTRAMPDNLGRYVLRRELGAGATGKVYLADDHFAGREVAVKVAHAELLAHPQNGQRYRRLLENEARLAGKMKHPHIVETLDAVVSPEQAYVVLEYVSGGTLEPFTRIDNLLPVDRVVELAFKCCQALAYANRHGLIHRDIKPANLMLSSDGEPKITDFGAAFWQSSDQTQVAGLIGSPAYMSPEQVREAPLTSQSDMFSLGVVLFQLLTGSLPFTADNDFAVIFKICNEPPPRLGEVRPGLPDGLQAILDRALAKSLDERYGDWAEFADDLRSVNRELSLPPDAIPEAERFYVLRGLAAFERFPDVALWEVLRISLWHRFPPDTRLIEEGKHGRSFFILASGSVRVLKAGRPIALLGAGETFGEMAFLAGEQERSATIVATSDVLLIKIRPDALSQASESLQALFNRLFLDLLVSRLANAGNTIADLVQGQRRQR